MMKNWKKDEIVEEVRKNREDVARREFGDPEKFQRESMRRAKRLGFQISLLKPMKIDFSRLHKKNKNVA